MKATNLLITLVLSVKRIADLQRKLRGFENLTNALASEVDRQRREIEELRAQQTPRRLNSFLKAA
jgi:predicted RNase H-like nuclease (RuvC/YqgF family)